MSEQYIVKGTVVVDGSQANATVARLTRGMTDSQRLTRDMGRGMSGMVGKVAGLAAGFLGVRSAVGQVSGALSFHNELEQSTSGLAALFRSVGHEGFSQSMSHASTAFVEIDELAASAYGETSDLFGILRSGYADLERMNVGWEDQKNLIRDVANTAGIVGEDLSFVGRDFQEMLAGRAHMGTNQLFTLAFAPQGITTESFNAMPEADRLAKIQEVMASMGGGEGAAAVGNSFAAQISTLASKFKMFREGFFAPIFEAVAVGLRRITAALGGGNTTKLIESLRRVGETMAGRIQPVVIQIADAFVYAANHFDEIVGKIRATAEALAKAAVVGGAVRGASAVNGFVAKNGGAIAQTVGPAISALNGQLMNLAVIARFPLAALQTLGGSMLTNLVVLARFPLATLRTLGGSLASLVGGGIPAALAAIPKLFTSMMMMITNPIATLSSGLAALSAGATALMAALGPVALIIGLVASLALAVSANWQKLMTVFAPILAYLGTAFSETFDSIWTTVSSIGQIIGELLAPGVMILLAVIVGALVIGLKALKLVFDAINLILVPIKDAIHSVFSNFLDFLIQVVSLIPGAGAPGSLQKLGKNGAPVAPPPETPDERDRNVNDFRGSRINISQDFKEADPDRVMFQVVNDINRQAERRISSGQTNPLTR